MIRKRFDFDHSFEHRHKNDVKRIQQVVYNFGYEADLESCATAWEKLSDSLAAGWISLPTEDEELWWDVRKYLLDD